MGENIRTRTLQERLGFSDSELKTPAHDAIMIWLDGEMEKIATDLFPVGESPGKKIFCIKKIWEAPVMSDKYLVGFVDMEVIVGFEEFSYGERKSAFLFFEVKPRIKSVGETIRQIRTYEEYVRRDGWTPETWRFFVVSPEDAFAEVLRKQGIGFIKVPPGVLK